MAVDERDPHTGHATTGHEWNGIKELNTPVPRVVLFFLVVTIIFSIGYWIVMPAWPLGETYTRGILNHDQRRSVDSVLKTAAGERQLWSARLNTLPAAHAQRDPALMKHVRESGPALFGDNCAACHGKDARGGPGFPPLTSSAWLWGGEPDAMAETIRVGINAAHPDTRVSQMPAFGSTKVLKPEEIENVALYVRSLSDPVLKRSVTAAAAKQGKELYLGNCASCHGIEGRGDRKSGAPNLTDRAWIYGGDAESISSTIWYGRQGHMPAWENRLSEVDRKILLLYLLDKRSKP